MHSFYLDAIRNFEGYTPQASWDYAQFSNGYGTRAQFAGEVIDRAEAERRFHAEVSSARAIVEKAAGHTDEGTKAALTSLTYNAGTAWIGSGLGDAVRRGDLDAVRDIFVQYNKAGGEVLQGLVSRRTQEAEWIGNPDMIASASRVDAGAATGLPPVVAERDQSARQVADLIRSRPAEATPAPESLVQRGPRVERAALAGAMGNVSSDALIALIGTDALAPDRVADIARLAQLDRGSELARSGQERADNETQRV
ncbi:glycoside hydrolase family protein [Hyphomicrobium sp. CS1GBMeth3]|uniref:lysozyme n=1 Tax=Hyphomicrobium sp. CS1GBMeth3 TaxID=1892845 RepID=UPI0009307516|nr:glycoside hydrolase family protein [Hyphomicrobium sp. CS1GBMeth3]